MTEHCPQGLLRLGGLRRRRTVVEIEIHQSSHTSGKKLQPGLSQFNSDRANQFNQPQGVIILTYRTRLQRGRRPYKKKTRLTANTKEKRKQFSQPSTACGFLLRIFFLCVPLFLGLSLGSSQFFSISVAADADAGAGGSRGVSRCSCSYSFLSFVSPVFLLAHMPFFFPFTF